MMEDDNLFVERFLTRMSLAILMDEDLAAWKKIGLTNAIGKLQSYIHGRMGVQEEGRETKDMLAKKTDGRSIGRIRRQYPDFRSNRPIEQYEFMQKEGRK